MKKACFLTLAAINIMVLSSFKIEDNISVHQINPFLKVFPESSYFQEDNNIVEIAAGEHAVFQFVMRSNIPLNDVKVSCPNMKDGNGNNINEVECAMIKYIHIGRRTPEMSADVVRSLSSLYPDQIVCKESFSVESNMAQPFWITASIPTNAEAGTYTGTVNFKGKAGKKSFCFSKEIKIKVYPVKLEKPTLWITNWFTTDSYALKLFNGGKNVEPYSDTYWKFVKELAKKMRTCYQNVVLISPITYTDYEKKGDEYTFDFTHFDKMVDTFKQAGVLERIEGGHLGLRTGGWDSQFGLYVPDVVNGKKVCQLLPVDDARTQNFYKQFIPSLMNHLREKHLDSCYIQHIADEPTEVNISSYIKCTRFIKSLAPGLHTIEACHTHDLENVLDIWVPQLNFYNEGYDFYKERQKAGNEVWFYTCCGPQGEYVNRFIELPLLKTRLIHWMNFRYGATGFLHWGFNFWGYDEDPNKEATRILTEGGTVLPAGDSWIVYPDNGKLNGSLRLEAMRDGVADYTLLKMLEKKNPQMAHELCRQIIYGWQQYDIEPFNFRQIRHKILENLSNN